MLDQFVLRKNTLIQVLDQAVAFARQKENSLAASLLLGKANPGNIHSCYFG